MPGLDRPRESTVRRLYALSMNNCAFPGCATKLVTIETGTLIGEVCHIRAHNPGGPRYEASQTDEERHGFDNLILLCGDHHKEVDATPNLDRFTIEWLLETKQAHEDQARETGEIEAPPEIVTALMWTVVTYEAGSTHMDFRNAYFKVGGDGGNQSGGGGGGGVLTIVGLASVPPSVANEMLIDLAGQPGQAYGGGGGGSGSLNFEGRAVNADDLARGLQISMFFPANSVERSEGLLYILGAGWSFLWVSKVPERTGINVAFAVDLGSIEPNTLLGFQLVVTNPSGESCGSTVADVAVGESPCSTNRSASSANVQFAVDSLGTHEVSMLSGGKRFASYKFDVKLLE